MEPSWIVVAGAALVPLGFVAAYLRARRRRGAQVAPRPAAPPVDRLRQGLFATRRRLAAELEAALRRGATEPEGALKELEEALVAADVGVRTSAELVARVRTRVGGAEIRQALQEEMEAILGVVEEPTPSARPWVVLVTGVNGVGKTTTIGKLAARHAAAGRSVLLVAGDTFRAAAIDQLAVWAARTGAIGLPTQRGDADAFNLWAGQAHELARARAAGEIVREMGAQARATLREATERLGA